MLTRDFIEKFMALNNRNTNVKIGHRLYGNQKLNKCVLHPFVDEGRIGLIIEDEERYITMDELISVCINEQRCCINGDVMEFCIEF